jgi:hypothetical protein
MINNRINIVRVYVHLLYVPFAPDRAFLVGMLLFCPGAGFEDLYAGGLVPVEEHYLDPSVFL